MPHDLYRPSNPSAKPNEPQRELTLAGKLDDESWRSSAKALDVFLSRTYNDSQIERALADAVVAGRFGQAGVTNQRTNIKLYFAVCQLMHNWKIRALPWSQRELDRLIKDWEMEPVVRDILRDTRMTFPEAFQKLSKNGAFDHLAGLCASIVAITYLPGCRQLLEDTRVTHRPEKDTVPSRVNEARPGPGVTTPVQTSSTVAPAAALADPRQAPKDSSIQTEESKKDNRPPISDVTQKKPTTTEKPIVKPIETAKRASNSKPASPVIPSATTPATAGPTVEIVQKLTFHGSSASQIIIQEGLEVLSEPTVMPFDQQFQLLQDVVRLLERSCFYWGQRTVPDLMKMNKWNMWQKVEIMDWLDLFVSLDGPLKLSESVRDEFVEKTFPALKQMRNDTIRRKERPVSAVSAMMTQAQYLTELLQDETCAAILKEICTRLSSIDTHSAETRSRLKIQFQREAVDISRRYMKLMEEEVKFKSAEKRAVLEQVQEQCDWNFHFQAPSDEHYTGGTSNQGKSGMSSYVPSPTMARATMASPRTPMPIVANSPIATRNVGFTAINGNASNSSMVAAATQHPAHTTTPQNANPLFGHRRASSSTHQADVHMGDAPVSRSGKVLEDAEAVAVANFSWTTAEPPIRDTLDYEKYWLSYKSTHKNPPQVALVSEALGLDKEAWEALRQAATKDIEEQGLIDIQSKETRAKSIEAQRAFKLKHHEVFKNLRMKLFGDLLCDLTFHSARRGINERSRRRTARENSQKQDTTRETTYESPRDPRLDRQARLQESMNRLDALRTSTSAANRQPAVAETARLGRPTAGDFFGETANAGKRARSPADDRRNAEAKRVKPEPLSQESAMPIHPGRAATAPMQYNLIGGGGTRISSIESGEIRENSVSQPADDSLSSNQDFVALA